MKALWFLFCLLASPVLAGEVQQGQKTLGQPGTLLFGTTAGGAADAVTTDGSGDVNIKCVSGCSGGGGGGASNITQWASTPLDAPSAYGVAPTGNVIGVNAFITNFPATSTTSNITQWASTTLGAPSAYGVAPTGNVAGVNAFITNFPATQSTSAAANTTGGTSTYEACGGTGNALLTNTAVAVKASAGNLYGVAFVNTGGVSAFVQMFDLATGSVTLGTTVPKMVFWVPAGGAWEEKFTGEAKVSFATAITVAATTTGTGNTAPSTGIMATVIYK